MGAMKQKLLEKRAAKSAGRENTRKAVLNGGGNPADWASVDAGFIQAAIAAVCADGGAIRFGYTRDGGAYAVGIYDDGQSETDYIRPSEDILGYFRAVIEDYTR